MNITGGITFSGAMGIRDQFPIATAANISAQSLTTGTAISSFNPFASVTSGIPPYTYSYTGTLPSGVTQNTSSGLVSGTPTVAQSSATVTFKVTDSAGVVATVTNAIGFTVAQGPYTVNYLVVAGGGGGSSAGGYSAPVGGGGGGAGGLLSGILTAPIGTSYTIQVGSGGAGGGATGGSPNTGSNGFSSNISAPGISTITTVGGGGGGSYTVGGSPGGSGGGAGSQSGIGPGGTGTPGQGYPGGTATVLALGTANGGGGGGGAGGSGANGVVGTGGSGGTGYTWSITGSTYAIGGAGGMGFSVSVGTPGSSYTGSGGTGAGGQAPAVQNGGIGGSGVVILAVPTPNYPGSAPGASVSTPPAAPGMTVLTYTTSGTYTA